MSRREVKALEEKGIKVGDTVRTAFRGGVRQGEVTNITPDVKVVFTRRRKGQPDKEVRHNPSTLEKVTSETEESGEELDKARGGKEASIHAGAKGGRGASKSKSGGAGGRGKGKGKAASQNAAPPKGGRVSKRKGAKKEPAAPTTPTKRAAKPRGAEGSKARGGGAGTRPKRKAAAPAAPSRKSKRQSKRSRGRS